MVLFVFIHDFAPSENLVTPMAGCSMVIIEEKQEKVNREKRVKAVLFTKEQRFFFDAMKKVMGVKTGRQ